MKHILLGAALILGAISGISSTAQANDAYCREYTKIIVIGGQQQVGYGTACLQRNGDWRIISDDERVSLKHHEVVRFYDHEKIAYHPVFINTQPKRYKKHSKNYEQKHYSKHDKKDQRHQSSFYWR